MGARQCWNDRPGFGMHSVTQKLRAYNIIRVLNIIKLKKTDCKLDLIKRNELYNFIISEYFNDVYYENIDFVKLVLKRFFMHPAKEQDNNHHFLYVQYRR